MKEINIGKTLIAKRREKGITQDDLAAFIGVSKASVSKWETGQSYPDITFLPQLAAYFNISVDELIGYAPQMTKEDIRRLYRRLKGDFAEKPFAGVLEECRATVKKYYSCFPLLLQMAGLLINHHMLAKERDLQEAVLQEAADLCRRIREENEEPWMTAQANSLEAFCALMLQRPEEVLERLEGTTRPSPSDETLLASAYQMTGKPQKAKEVMQVGIYQHLVQLVGMMPAYLTLFLDDAPRFEIILNRTLTTAEAFSLDTLHQGAMASLYLTAASGFAAQGSRARALEMLERYANLCAAFVFPVTLHGDAFFDRLDGWFEEFELGPQAPRDEKVIKESMLQGVEANPAFAALAQDPGFKNIVDTMKNRLGGN